MGLWADRPLPWPSARRLFGSRFLFGLVAACLSTMGAGVGGFLQFIQFQIGNLIQSIPTCNPGRVGRVGYLFNSRNHTASNVGFAPDSDQTADIARGRVRARAQSATSRHYSITSSARTSSEGGIVIPSVLAVFRLTTSSSLVGNSMGKFSGLVPFMILSMKAAARRKFSRMLIL